MGKHINTEQEDTLIDFMEKHPNLAKGFAKGDRTEIEKLLQTLAGRLNSIGPPVKEPEAWKKAWSDKKSQIKRKLAINKRESRATGGGPYNQLYISSRDEAISKLCGLYGIVDGIENSFSCGFRSLEANEERPTNSTDSSDVEQEEQELPTTSSQARKRKIESHSIQDNLKKFMTDESFYYSELSKTLIKLQSTAEENKDIQKSLESNTRRMYRAFDKMNENFNEQTKAIKEQTEELKKQRIENERHNKEMEKATYEKNILKRQLLELQNQQLDLYKV